MFPSLRRRSLLCRRKATPFRLQTALRALHRDFLLVGVAENLPDYMEALELLLPHFFRGARDAFRDSGQFLGGGGVGLEGAPWGSPGGASGESGGASGESCWCLG